MNWNYYFGIIIMELLFWNYNNEIIYYYLIIIYFISFNFNLIDFIIRLAWI